MNFYNKIERFYFFIKYKMWRKRKEEIIIEHKQENKFESFLKKIFTNENILFASNIAKYIFVILWWVIIVTLVFYQRNIMKDNFEYIWVLEKKIITLWNVNEQLKQEWDLLKNKFENEKEEIKEEIEWVIQKLEKLKDWIFTESDMWENYYKELEWNSKESNNIQE